MKEFPQAWVLSTLGQLAGKGQYGWTTKAIAEGKIKFLRTTDITKGAIDWENVPFCCEVPSNKDQYNLRSGDILISRAGSVGFSVLLENIPFPAVFASYLIRYLPEKTIVVPRYLASFLKSQSYWKQIAGASSGIALANVNASKLSELIVPLAPLNEQKRIADKLDSILARVEACRERLDRIPVILKRFRQAVLAAATSGKLTEEWRNLNKIFTHDLSWKLTEQRAQLWIGRGKYRPAIAAEDIECDEFTNLPDSWIRGTLDQITWSVKDGPHYSPEYRKSGVPFISGGSIKPGKIDLSIAKYIDPILHHELCQRCKPEYHDILYTKGGTTGIAAVNTLKVDFNVWVHVAVLKLISKELVNPFFVQHALNSPYCYSQSQRYTHGVGNQDLGLTRMIKIVIPIPPIEEQTEIVRRVEELFAFADRIEARYQAARARIDKLTPAILAKAFRGELVPQNPDDESASVLLERIQASRAKNEATLKPKRSRNKAISATDRN